MKSLSLLPLVILFFVPPLTSRAESPPVVRVLSIDCFKADEKGKGADKSEYWSYRIKLQNASDRDLTDIEVRTRIFQLTELNPDRSSASPLSFLPETLSVPTLKKSETTTINTMKMELKLQNDSRRIKVKADRDIFKGIWVRVFDKAGKELGSLVKPPSIAKTMPWQ